MKAKTELFLYHLLWFGEVSLAGSLAKQLWSFETWSNRHGLARQIQRLQNQSVLEAERNEKYGRLLKLVESPPTPALSYDPKQRWSHDWNGRWTTVVFDIDESNRPLRDKLRGMLRSRKFGCLQRSVWISPFPDPDLATELKRKNPASANFWMTEGRDLLALDARKIAHQAWNFTAVQEACRMEAEILDGIEQAMDREEPPSAWESLIRKEHQAWTRILEADPFLPQALCPSKYIGPTLWDRRSELIAQCRSLGLGLRAD